MVETLFHFVYLFHCLIHTVINHFKTQTIICQNYMDEKRKRKKEFIPLSNSAEQIGQVASALSSGPRPTPQFKPNTLRRDEEGGDDR
jgi:hypothetical protein